LIVTPISAPAFSKTYTCLMAGSANRFAVLSVHASRMSRTRLVLKDANVASWSAVKATTSQRPPPRRTRCGSGPISSSGGSGGPDSEGKRFSNTATS
jgi:hypothetical protein